MLGASGDTYANHRATNNPIARFVHYTSADAALKIIGSKRVWMRNTTCMAHYREVQHGYEITSKFFSNPAKRDPFYRALDKVSSSGTTQEAVIASTSGGTTSASALTLPQYLNIDEKEDLHGRLSMWRAFGGSGAARVAIVFRVPWVANGSAALNLMFNPVAYLREKASGPRSL